MNASGLDTVLSALRGENAAIGGEKSGSNGENAEFLAAFDAASRAAEAPKSLRAAAPAPSHQAVRTPPTGKSGEIPVTAEAGGKALPADTASPASASEGSSPVVADGTTAAPEQGEPVAPESNSGVPASASETPDSPLAAWVRPSAVPQGQPAESASTVAKAVHQALEARVDTSGGASGGSRDGSLPSGSAPAGAASSGDPDVATVQARNRDFVAAVRDAVAGVEPRAQGAAQPTASSASSTESIDNSARSSEAVIRSVPQSGTTEFRTAATTGSPPSPPADAEIEPGRQESRVTANAAPESRPAVSEPSTDPRGLQRGADVPLAARESGAEPAKSIPTPADDIDKPTVKGLAGRDALEQRIARFASALRSSEQTSGRVERPQPDPAQQSVARGLSGQAVVAQESIPTRPASGLERFIVEGEPQTGPDSGNRAVTPGASSFGLATASAASSSGEVRSAEGTVAGTPASTSQAPTGTAAVESRTADVMPEETTDGAARVVRDSGPAPEPTAAQRGFESAFAQATASQPSLGRGVETTNTPVATLPDMASTPDSNEFPQELLGRLRLLQSQGSHEARLNLHPAELGRMQISITTEGDTTRVAFTVDNAQARDAIEQAMPRLRELLGQAGLQLADSTVSQQGEHQSRESSEDSGSRLASSGSEGEPEDGTEDAAGKGRNKPDPERTVDAYV